MTTHLVETTPARTDWTTTAPPRLRRVVGAVCLPATFLAMLATGPLDPFDDEATAAVQLGQLHGHVATVHALAQVELLAAALAAGLVLAFAGLTRGRGRGLANAGVVLGVLGVLGMALVAVNHLVLAALADQPVAVGAQIVDALHAGAGPVALVALMAMPLAMVLLASAGFRAGFVPAPAFALALAFFVGELVPGLPGGEVGPLLLGLLAFGWTAVVIIRGGQETSGPRSAE